MAHLPALESVQDVIENQWIRFFGFTHLMHSVKASEVGRGKGAVTFAGGRFADKKCRLCFCSVGLKSVQQQQQDKEEEGCGLRSRIDLQ